MHDVLPAIASLAEERRAATDADHKARWGQFFTPPGVAAFMAGLLSLDAVGNEVTVLDPGAGAGILGVAVARALLASGVGAVHLVGVEAEPAVQGALKRAYRLAQAEFGPALRTTIRSEDFLSLHSPQLGVDPLPAADVVIANPPYFKMSPTEPHGGDAPNAYARFMEVAASFLRPGGQFVFIVPRSFASGLYFQKFRRRFHASMHLVRTHVFESRRDAFHADDVLQENLIVVYRRGGSPPATVTISSSNGARDLDSPRTFTVRRELALRDDDRHGVVNLPTSEADVATMREVLGWRSSLHALGLEISTGPVVPFRTDCLLRNAGQDTVPMLWMQHVRAGEVRWPLGGSFRKAEHLRRDAGDKLLVPNRTYILLRRFSAKEEPRRLTVAVLRGGRLPGPVIGLENHLNYIHRPGGELDDELALGLAALLASTLLDDFFRIQSGNTQVSSTEIRALPLPSEAQLRAFGRGAEAVGEDVLTRPADLDALLEEVLRQSPREILAAG